MVFSYTEQGKSLQEAKSKGPELAVQKGCYLGSVIDSLHGLTLGTGKTGATSLFGSFWMVVKINLSNDIWLLWKL